MCWISLIRKINLPLCIENKSIDDAYNFDQDYRKAHGDWYETPKDESLVIKFTTSDEEKKDPENKE